MVGIVEGLAIASTVASVAASAQQAAAQKAAGEAAKQSAKFQAMQHEQVAGQERAAAQREAFNERRIADLTRSRAIAVAAASGGGVSDPTVVDILGAIDEEGEYRALTALFSGESRAQTRETAADVARFEGKQAEKAGKAQASATMVGGLTTAATQGLSLYDRFGKPANAAVTTTTAAPRFQTKPPKLTLPSF